MTAQGLEEDNGVPSFGPFDAIRQRVSDKSLKILTSLGRKLQYDLSWGGA